MMSVALLARRNASPSGAVMWKLRDYIVAPLGLKNMMPTYRYHRPAGAGIRESMGFFSQEDKWTVYTLTVLLTKNKA